MVYRNSRHSIFWYVATCIFSKFCFDVSCLISLWLVYFSCTAYKLLHCVISWMFHLCQVFCVNSSYLSSLQNIILCMCEICSLNYLTTHTIYIMNVQSWMFRDQLHFICTFCDRCVILWLWLHWSFVTLLACQVVSAIEWMMHKL